MTQYERLISGGTIAIGGFVLMLMMLQVVVDVVLRQVLGAGFPATPDLVGKYYMVALAVLPIALTEVKRRHIEATIFTDKLPERARNAFGLLGFVLATAVYGLLTYASTTDALRQTAKGAYIEAGVLKVLTWPSYWFLPLAFGAMAILTALRVWATLTGRFTVHEHDPLEEINSDIEGNT